MEIVKEAEVIKELGQVTQFGFGVEEPDGSFRDFWPRYLYVGPTETLERQEPYEEPSSYEAVSYIHKRAEDFAEYAKTLFEAGL